MKLKRLKSDYIAIRKRDETNISAGGVLMPEKIEAAKMVSGEIVHVGPGRYEHGTFVEVNLQIGSVVLFSSHAHCYEHEDLLIMRASEVIGIAE